VQIGFIMFNPYSTSDELLENAQFLYDIGELYRFFPLSLAMSAFPGTPIVNRLIRDGLLDQVDYREPLHCFCYANPSVARIVDAMHELYEQEHELDAHILRAIGYDGRNVHSALRHDMANINLNRFVELVSAVEAEDALATRRVIARWPRDIQICLDGAGLPFAPAEQHQVAV
jgi:hypothetical protein